MIENCQAKQKFSTQEEAEEQLSDLLKSENVRDPEGLHTYHCHLADHWHFGHQPSMSPNRLRVVTRAARASMAQGGPNEEI